MFKSADMKYLVFGVLILVFFGLVFYSNRPNRHSAEHAMLLKAEDTKIVALGKKIYSSNCASCHGENLEGQPNWKRPGSDGLMPAPPHNDTGHTWHHSDDILFGITKLGVAKFSGLENYKTNMPAYEDILSDSEIIAVLSYIKSTWPETVRTRHDEMNAQNVNNEKR